MTALIETTTIRTETKAATTKVKKGCMIHSWFLLPISEETLAEIRQLVSFGHGDLHAPGVDLKAIADKVCVRCHEAHSVTRPFIDALKKARGL